MEDCFVAACFKSFLRSHNAGDKVKGFNIAMEKSCIFNCYKFEFLFDVIHLFGYTVNQKISLGFGEDMISYACSSCALPIDKLVGIIYLAYAIIKDVCKLLFCAGRLNAKLAAAVKETVNMLFKVNNNAVD